MTVSVTAVLKVVIIKFVSASLFMMVRGAIFPSNIAWKVSNTFGSFSKLEKERKKKKGVLDCNC